MIGGFVPEGEGGLEAVEDLFAGVLGDVGGEHGVFYSLISGRLSQKTYHRIRINQDFYCITTCFFQVFMALEKHLKSLLNLSVFYLSFLILIATKLVLVVLVPLNHLVV